MWSGAVIGVWIIVCKSFGFYTNCFFPFPYFIPFLRKLIISAVFISITECSGRLRRLWLTSIVLKWIEVEFWFLQELLLLTYTLFWMCRFSLIPFTCLVPAFHRLILIQKFVRLQENICSHHLLCCCDRSFWYVGKFIILFQSPHLLIAICVECQRFTWIGFSLM